MKPKLTIHWAKPVCNTGTIRAQALRIMLDHLIDFEPPAAALDEVAPLEKVAPQELLDAQLSTAQWLESIGAPPPDAAEQSAAQSTAQKAFGTIIKNAVAPEQRAALVALKTPSAVRHLTGMLTAYDWEFVEQAKEIRGYAVSQLLEETKHPDAKIRLRALELLGRVTEVALFTDRVEVKKTSVSDAELDAKIKEKLARFAGVVDVNPTDVEVIEQPKQDEAA